MLCTTTPPSGSHCSSYEPSGVVTVLIRCWASDPLERWFLQPDWHSWLTWHCCEWCLAWTAINAVPISGLFTWVKKAMWTKCTPPSRCHQIVAAVTVIKCRLLWPLSWYWPTRSLSSIRVVPNVRLGSDMCQFCKSTEHGGQNWCVDVLSTMLCRESNYD